MELVLDLGNSNLVFGVFKDSKLLTTGRTITNRYKSEDEYASTLRELLFLKGISLEDIEGIIISSVVPQLTSVLSSAVEILFKKKPMIIGAGIKTGIQVRTDNPSEVGSDIIAGCVGAVKKYGTPVIVIDMGTATKICLVDERNVFQGCVIAPGARVSMDALVKVASQLPNVNFSAPSKTICKNTPDCMNSGIVYGNACMIDGMIERIEDEVGYKCKLVATGGLSSSIVKHCKKDIIIDADLLLVGIHEIYMKNIGGK